MLLELKATYGNHIKRLAVLEKLLDQTLFRFLAELHISIYNEETVC